MREITRTVLKFLIGFILVLILSSFLAPWLHTFLPFKFDRILRRCIMIGTLLLGVWLVRSRRESLNRIGLGRREGWAGLFWIGFLSGVALVAVITSAQWAFGARLWRLHETDVWHWIGLFFKGFGGGMLIGIIEETFFRGFLFVMFKDLWNVRASLIVTNLIYSVVHFFPKNKPLTGLEPAAWDSFRILSSMFPSLFEKPETSLALSGLFLFGLLLSLAMLRSGSLFLPIGIHAGAVFGLKMNRRFVPEIAGTMDIWSGSKNLYDGVLGSVLLLLIVLVLGLNVKRSLSTSARRKAGLVLFSILILGLLVFPIPVSAQDPGRPPGEIVYSFIERLSQARAIKRGQGNEVHQARWIASRFRFDELPGMADILVSEGILVKGKTRTVIRIQALPGYESELVYKKVPPGRRMRIFFALADSNFRKGKEQAPVEFEVWIGAKKLYETRVNSRGWQAKTLDMTLPRLLQRGFRVSFKVRTSGEQLKNFVFYGYIE